MYFYTLQKFIERKRMVDKQREQAIDKLVGRGKINNAYITNKKTGSSVDLSVQMDYIQVAYPKENKTEFKKIDCSVLL